MIATFFDGATLCDGARFSTPPVSAIITARPRLKVFYDGASGAAERERTFSDLGSTPARRYILLEQTEGGGSQLDVWLTTDHRGATEGCFDATSWRGPMLPLRWSPAGGLDAPAAIAWAADTFGRRNALKVRTTLAEMCARAWLEALGR